MHFLVVALTSLAFVPADATAQNDISSQRSSQRERSTISPNEGGGVGSNTHHNVHISDDVFLRNSTDPPVPLLCNLTGHWRWSESTTLDIVIEMTGTLTFNVTLYPLGIDWKTATGQCMTALCQSI